MAKEANKNKKKEVSKDKKNFGKDFKAELKKVSWPSLKQLVNNTSAVIVIVLITAAIVFILDVAFETLNKYGVENLKAIVTSSSSKTNTDDAQEVEIENVTTDDDTSAASDTTDEANSEETNTVTEETTANSVEQ